MLALYIASKGGSTFQNVQDWLPKNQWAELPLQEGSVAVAWRAIVAMAAQVFTPPWQLFLRYHLSSCSPNQGTDPFHQLCSAAMSLTTVG